MKPYGKISFHLLGCAFLSAVAVLALTATPVGASDIKPLPASILRKLDSQLVLVVKKSRGEAPLDTSTAQQPNIYAFGGRVLVEIQGTFSRELSDQIAGSGGQVVVGWGTTTNFRAWVPFAQLETLAGRMDIQFISAARPSMTHRTKRPG